MDECKVTCALNHNNIIPIVKTCWYKKFLTEYVGFW
jgi:hypothetical protein